MAAMDDKPEHDWGATTAVIAFVRKRITPAAAWSAIIGTLTVTVLAVTAWVGSQKNISHLQEIAAQQTAHEQKTDELLQQLVTGQAVMNNSMNEVRAEQDRQRAWRERIEEVADEKPKGRRRRE